MLWFVVYFSDLCSPWNKAFLSTALITLQQITSYTSKIWLYWKETFVSSDPTATILRECDCYPANKFFPYWIFMQMRLYLTETLFKEVDTWQLLLMTLWPSNVTTFVSCWMALGWHSYCAASQGIWIKGVRNSRDDRGGRGSETGRGVRSVQSQRRWICSEDSGIKVQLLINCVRL